MHPETLREHIQKCKAATDKPFGVNIPLMYPEIDILINMVIEEGVKIVFTSAGNPKTWTEHLHEHGIIVAHVVASTKFAAKCEEAGVDAIVAEGFEAGGHNGREETTTLCLIPAVRQITTVPLIAAGGIGSGCTVNLTGFARQVSQEWMRCVHSCGQYRPVGQSPSMSVRFDADLSASKRSRKRAWHAFLRVSRRVLLFCRSVLAVYE